MAHLPVLIEDLGLILVAAAAVTILFKALKQPVVLGYLIAGFLVGPNFHVFPSVQDANSISIWAEIGVIFMLFGLGLEFSFKKLARVGRSASVTAVVEILVMLGLGYLTGHLLGWSNMDSLFLGGILSISSTTIIVRAFEELGLKGQSFVALVFGVLIVEDILAILLLVLLSSVAATQTLSGSDILQSTLRLGFFLVLWFVLGLYLLPGLLRRFQRLLSDETLLIVSLGLCLLMVIIATQVGFSPALGAFVMGSILAETAQGEKIEHLLEPVKNLFSAVFFVSVGMLIQPQILREHLGVVLLISAVTIFGKLLSSAFGALLAGRSFKTSLQAGLSLAQIGEFSFIIATLGLTLKVTSDFLYPIAVAVSALTTFTTPYLIRSAEALAIRLERRLPPGVREALDRYQSNLSTTSNRTVFAGIWHAYGPKTALNSVMVIAIGLAATYLLPESTEMGRLVACLLTLILASPFLWAIFFGTSTKTTPYILGVTLVRALIGLSLTLFVLSPFLSTVTFSGLVLVVLGAFAIFWFTPFSRWVYARLETRFLSNLQAEPAHPKLAPWNAGLAAYTLTSASPLAALTLQNSGLKERYGVTVAMLERAGARFVAPDRDMILWPGDNLFLLGSDEQLAAVQPRIEAPVPVDAENDDIGLVSLRLDATHPLTGKSIRDCGLRESALGLIVGVERGGERHLNPDPSMQLSAGDLIWVVGQRRPLRRLRSTTTT